MWAQASSLVLRHSWRSRPSGTSCLHVSIAGRLNPACCRVTSLGERKPLPGFVKAGFLLVELLVFRKCVLRFFAVS